MNKRVTPQAIAYIAVMVRPINLGKYYTNDTGQLHFNSTDANQWAENYNGFDYAELYDFILGYFLGGKPGSAERKIADDKLAWWNKYVRPLLSHSTHSHPGRKIFPNRVPEATSAATTSVSRLAAQRAALLAASVPSSSPTAASGAGATASNASPTTATSDTPPSTTTTTNTPESTTIPTA